MADYCKQCSENLFGPGYNDAAGLISKEEADAKQLVVHFLCEGCGPTLVDHEGACVTGQHGHTCSDPTHCGG